MEFSLCYPLRHTNNDLISHIQRLHVPNTISILINNPIRSKEAHTSHARNALCNPLILILERFIYDALRRDI